MIFAEEKEKETIFYLLNRFLIEFGSDYFDDSCEDSGINLVWFG